MDLIQSFSIANCCVCSRSRLSQSGIGLNSTVACKAFLPYSRNLQPELIAGNRRFVLQRVLNPEEPKEGSRATFSDCMASSELVLQYLTKYLFFNDFRSQNLIVRTPAGHLRRFPLAVNSFSRADGGWS